MNYFEELDIQKKDLPEAWQSQNAQNELEDFLQANWAQRSVFYEDGYVGSRQQFLTFKAQQVIRTNNYIGTIVFKGAQINIFPKVYRTKKSDTDASSLTLEKLMYNLVKWLEYCDKVDYPFISIKSELDDCNNLQDLFITLYVRYVKYAVDRAIYYKYEDETEDCSSLKGQFDLVDFYTKKMQNGEIDKFKCTYSSFEVDNKINRIIKYTCKQLFNFASRSNQKIIRHVLFKLNEVSDVLCTPGDCDRIRLSKMHRNYSVILSMSKMFLLNKSTSYNVDDAESFCFLFPTDILFEGFVTGFIRNMLQETATVKAQASDMSLVKNVRVGDRSFGKKFRLMNDILVETDDGKVFVLDTKYKEINRFEGNDDPADDIKQPDLYQVREYARKRNLHEAYLLYPMYYDEPVEPNYAVLEDEYVSDGIQYALNVIAVRIPFIFEENEENTKAKLTTAISSIFNDGD